MFVLLTLFIIVGYFYVINDFIWAWGRSSVHSFIYSCFYLLFWLIILFHALRKNLKGLWVLYCVYWLSSFVIAIIIPTPLGIMAMFYGLVTIVPMVGIMFPFSQLIEILELNPWEIFSWDIATIPIAFVSAVMLLLGFLCKRKSNRKNLPK